MPNRIAADFGSLCCLILLLFSSPVFAQQPLLTGHIIGLGNKPVVFGYKQNKIYKLDTVFAKNDVFSYHPKPSDDGLINLRINRPRYTSFWYEPGNITVTGSIEKPYKLVFTNGRENNTLTVYNETVLWPYEEKKLEKTPAELASLEETNKHNIQAFIRSHPDSRTSAYLLYWETLVSQEQAISVYTALLEQLTPTVQQSYYGVEAKKRINILQNQPIVGRKAPNFNLSDTTGATFSLETHKGKYVLLDFWGHWCAPCMRDFPKLKLLQQKYADKLTIIGIAAEFNEDKAVWARAIQKNEAAWLQLSELAGDKGLVNEQYNIMAFPTYLLLDKQGVVLSREPSVEAIEAKLLTLTP